MKFNLPPEDANASGIYAIRCRTGNKLYIGSAVNFKERHRKHPSKLVHGTHNNVKLLAHYRKHGAADLEFSLVEFVDPDPEELTRREQVFIDSMRPDLNICRQAGRTTGYKHTAETKALIKEKRALQVLTPESNAKRSAANRGQKRTPETCARIGAGRKGKATKIPGVRHYNSRLPEVVLTQMHVLFAEGKAPADIAKQFNLTLQGVRYRKNQWEQKLF